MQRPVSKKSRAINANEKRRLQWLKDRATCSACGREAPVINHHCEGSAAKAKLGLETILIGHAFVISLCQECDDLVTRGSRRALTDRYGLQSELWLRQEEENPDPAPDKVRGRYCAEEYMMGEYYLHTNGSLIYKPAGGVELDSPFVVKVWRAESIGATPQDFVEFLAEAVERGANHGRVVELANHNHLDQYVADWRDRVFPEAKGQA